MDNQQIINQRWKKTERIFRQKSKTIRDLYYLAGDEVIEIVRIVNPEYSKLNTIVPNDVKRYAKKRIDEWKEEGIVTGYFAFLLLNLTRYTYQKVLEILIYGAYLSMNRKLYSVSKEIFQDSIQDLYEQGKRELKETPRRLKWSEIEPLLLIPAINQTFKVYQEAVNMTNAQEMSEQIITMLRSKVIISHGTLDILLVRQANRMLKAKDGKYSGTIPDTARASGNKAYIEASEKDQLVRFVAEMDDRTTKMCRSLDGQIFHTRKWNVFERYSEFYQSLHKFSCKGMQIGLNLPPINDHFHWCRSTVTYQVENTA